MRTVYKYQVAVDDYQEIELPRGARILSVQAQGTHIYLWALVDPEVKSVTRKIWILGTGHPFKLENELRVSFVGTVQVNYGPGILVWHVFSDYEVPE